MHQEKGATNLKTDVDTLKHLIERWPGQDGPIVIETPDGARLGIVDIGLDAETGELVVHTDHDTQGDGETMAGSKATGPHGPRGGVRLVPRTQIGWILEALGTEDDIEEFQLEITSDNGIGFIEPLSEYTADSEVEHAHRPGELYRPIPVFIEVEPGQYRVPTGSAERATA